MVCYILPIAALNLFTEILAYGSRSYVKALLSGQHLLEMMTVSAS